MHPLQGARVQSLVRELRFHVAWPKRGEKNKNQSQASLRLGGGVVGDLGEPGSAGLLSPPLGVGRGHTTTTFLSPASQSPQHPLGSGCGCRSNTPQIHPRPQTRVSSFLPSLLKPPDSQIFLLLPVLPPKPSGPSCLTHAPSNAPRAPLEKQPPSPLPSSVGGGGLFQSLPLPPSQGPSSDNRPSSPHLPLSPLPWAPSS